MSRFNDDRFRYLERVTNEKGGASVDEISKAFGLSKASTITWLCRWENYYNRFRDIVQHFLTRVPGEPPIYKIGPDWWGERFNNGMGENWHDVLDVEGINPLHVSLGFIKTRTDSITHKRTLSGVRRKPIYLAWIKSNNGVSSAKFAREFGLKPHNASTTLSLLKKEGLVERINGMWVARGQLLKETEIVKAVVGEYDELGRRHTREEWQAVEKENTNGDEHK